MRVADIFYITGRGFVVTTRLNEDAVINAGDIIEINGNERYVVIGIDRFRVSLGLSKDIGILIRGGLQRDRSEYYGCSIEVIKP